jgi:hypothetical protein
MGGNALGFRTERLSPERYIEITTLVVDALLHSFYKRVVPTSPCPNKESHGDVDILVCESITSLDPRAVFRSTAVVHNGGVTSFDFKGHQIDLIHVRPEHFEMATFFYGYGDVGMILGMITRTVGLKFGYQGLSIVVHSHLIPLSTDLTETLRFLGLDVHVWRRGFTTDEQVFAFITSSTLFRPSMFRRRDDKWNHGERRALQDRTMFVAFIAYVEQNYPSETEPARLSVEEVSQRAIDFFQKQSALDAVNEKIERGRKLKERFNGHMVMEITGMSGKEMGAFMAQCKEAITEDKILSMSPDEMRQWVSDFYQSRTS